MMVLKEAGVDLGDFESTALTDQLIKDAGLILVMSAAHKAEVIRRVPEAAAKTFLLREYGRDEKCDKPVDPDIPDPIGQSASEYKVCLRLIKEAIERVAILL